MFNEVVQSRPARRITRFDSETDAQWLLANTTLLTTELLSL